MRVRLSRLSETRIVAENTKPVRFVYKILNKYPYVQIVRGYCGKLLAIRGHCGNS